jgi:L-fuculose-phosphate aldolase
MAMTKMLLETARCQVVEYAQQLIPDGLSVGTSGNISAREGDLIAITPSRMDYAVMRPEHVCVVDLAGCVVDGSLPPSSEVPLHLALYLNQAVMGIVHTHPLFATTVSTIATELPAVHYLLARLGGPVPVAPYATYGSWALAENVATAMAGRTAVIMANHGAVTVGDSLAAAYSRSIILEWVSRLYIQAKTVGDPALLSQSQLDEAFARMSGKAVPESMPAWAKPAGSPTKAGQPK